MDADFRERLEEKIMAILSGQFADALVAIEPSAKDKMNAPRAHEVVRDALTSAADLKDWNLNPVLIGSYKRDVSIRRVKDVDVFCRMEGIGNDVSASSVLDRYFAVLDTEFGADVGGKRRVHRQSRSLKIEFPEYENLHVDAVPARRSSDGYWEIPTSEGNWQLTNPEELTSLKTIMNDSFNGGYVKLVKLVRQTRRTILGQGVKPGGLFVEMALYNACADGLVAKEGLAIGYVTGLEAIANYLSDKVTWDRDLPDPTMPGHMLTFRATDKQWETARDRFGSAAVDAREAYLESDSGKAALIFQKLLGENGDGDTVFPMPPGYNADGTKGETAFAITPGSRHVPAGDHRFG